MAMDSGLLTSITSREPGESLMGLFVVRGIECGSEFNGGAGDYIRVR